MSKIETLRSLPSASQLSAMTAETLAALEALPERMGEQIAQSLEPLDRLDRTLDQHLSIIQPLIDQAAQKMQEKIEGLAHDRVLRSVRMAQEQHRKARQARRAAKDWREEAKTLQDQKTNMQEQISQWKLRFWVATSVAVALAEVLALMTLGRFL